MSQVIIVTGACCRVTGACVDYGTRVGYGTCVGIKKDLHGIILLAVAVGPEEKAAGPKNLPFSSSEKNHCKIFRRSETFADVVSPALPKSSTRRRVSC